MFAEKQSHRQGSVTQVFAKSRLLESAKRCSHISLVVRVDEHSACLQFVTDIQGLVDILGEDTRGQAKFCGIGPRQHRIHVPVGEIQGSLRDSQNDDLGTGDKARSEFASTKLLALLIPTYEILEGKKNCVEARARQKEKQAAEQKSEVTGHRHVTEQIWAWALMQGWTPERQLRAEVD